MKKIFVANINFDASETELKEFLSEYGEILDVLIPTNYNGNKRGFAFVTFKEEADAEKCKTEANDREFMGRKLYIADAVDKRRTF